MPTNALITYEFGDGSTVDRPFTIPTAGGTQDITHTYTSDGLFETLIIVSNEATSVNKTVQVRN